MLSRGSLKGRGGGVPSTNLLNGLCAEALTRVWKSRGRDSEYCRVISCVSVAGNSSKMLPNYSMKMFPFNSINFTSCKISSCKIYIQECHIFLFNL